MNEKEQRFEKIAELVKKRFENNERLKCINGTMQALIDIAYKAGFNDAIDIVNEIEKEEDL